MPLLNRSEANIIWQRLDTDNSGGVTLAELLKNAGYLQKKLPDLLSDFERISVNGTLDGDTFLENYHGKKKGEGSKNKKRMESPKLRQESTSPSVQSPLFQSPVATTIIGGVRGLICHVKNVDSHAPAIPHDDIV